MKELVKQALERSNNMNLNISNQQMYELVSAIVGEKNYHDLNKKLKSNETVNDLKAKVKPIVRLKDFCQLEGVSHGGVCLMFDESWLNASDENLTRLKRGLEKMFLTQDENKKHNRELFTKAKERMLLDLKECGLDLNTRQGHLRSKYQDILNSLEKSFKADYSSNSNAKVDFAYITINGKREEFSIKRSPSGIIEGLKDLAKKKEQDVKRAKKSNKLYTKACVLASKYDIDATSFDNEQELINLVTDKAKEAYLEENYPEGTELDFSGCDYCDECEVGDRRCSCGNRRVYLAVEGNLLDGFYAYPEPY